MGGHQLRLDLVERHRGGVEQTRPSRTMRQQFARHDRARIEADRAARDEIAPAQRDEVGRARSGTDEMHRHGAAPEVAASDLASAQVAGPIAIRGTTRRPAGPAAASAAASATDPPPISSPPRPHHLAPPPPPSRSASATYTSRP